MFNWSNLTETWYTVKTFNYLFQDSLFTKAFRLLYFNNRILLTGYVYLATNRYHLLLACLDTNFNVLWEKKYQRNNSIGDFWGFDIEPTLDGGYLIGGLNTTFPEWNTINKGMMLKTDGLGNELWRKTLSYPSSVNGGGLRVKTRSDGLIMYAGQQDVAGGLERLRFGSVDINGNILSDTLIGPAIDDFGTQPIVKTPDGNYVIGGTTQQGHWRSMLYKFSEQGDEIWHRYYHRGDKADASSLYNYKVAPDSGIIMAGTYYDLFNNPTNKAIFHWLKKVDQYGCEVANCHNVGADEAVLPPLGAEVYPNPSTGQFYLRVPAGTLKAEEIYVHDVSGQSVKCGRKSLGNGLFAIDLSDYPDGIYFLHLGGEMGQASLKLVKSGR